MLSIGEFSNICQVSTKTLRYYAEIGLLLPNEINPENGYRYYAMEQLETMLFINRLKSYHFSLEEIKKILDSDNLQEEKLYKALLHKKAIMTTHLQEYTRIIHQLEKDMDRIKQGKSILSYLEEIKVEMVEVDKMNLVSIRKMVLKEEFEKEYPTCFNILLKKIAENKFTMASAPMVLYYSDTFSPYGLDTEFAIAIKEQDYLAGTRDFYPGLCLKTVLHGSYANLSSVYTKQCMWAKENGYVSTNALYEIYVVDPTQVESEEDLVTEIYFPVTKSSNI